MAESQKGIDPGHLIGHVKDADYFEVPRFLGGRIELPQLPSDMRPEIKVVQTGKKPLDDMFERLDLRLTKFMVLEVVAVCIVAFVFIRLAGKMSSGDRPRGRLSNLLEAMLLFIRDEVARPAIGGHDADKFLPFLWTTFFFILTSNLLGMVPWAGSPTGAFAVTGTLAIITFLTVIGSGMVKLGPLGFWLAQVPHMDLPLAIGVVLKPMIFGIEVLGLCIKHFVLSVRLLANMFAGHVVLAVLITFIQMAWHAPLYLGIWGVTPASVLASALLSLLELFVAFLQAYIFTFLASLFIGMAVHPH